MNYYSKETNPIVSEQECESECGMIIVDDFISEKWMVVSILLRPHHLLVQNIHKRN